MTRPPNAESLIVALNSLHTDIGTVKRRIEEQQGDQTYATALKLADDLIGLRATSPVSTGRRPNSSTSTTTSISSRLPLTGPSSSTRNT